MAREVLAIRQVKAGQVILQWSSGSARNKAVDITMVLLECRAIMQ